VFYFQECPFYSETFYPGQIVGGPSKAFKDAKWISGVKPILHNQSHVKATVEEVSYFIYRYLLLNLFFDSMSFLICLINLWLFYRDLEYNCFL